MPAAARRILTDAVLRALREGGGVAFLRSTGDSNPRRILVEYPDASVSVYAYVWTLTPGGRPSLPYEYRVQMTGVTSPLPVNPEGPTLLLGYEPSLDVFAGFDLSAHTVFTTGSPSVQVDLRIVRKAIAEGIALDRKANGEVVCGIRPDRLAQYARDAKHIHRSGRERVVYPAMEDALRGSPISERTLRSLAAPRRKTLQEVLRWSRAANFRKIVLQAYDHRCAITGLQLRLVDAAHILPVGAEGSSDDVRNGIALSPTFHRAYDQGLVYLGEDFSFHLNAKTANLLAKHRLDAGLDQIRSAVERPIVMPANPDLRPGLVFIRKANRIRLTG